MRNNLSELSDLLWLVSPGCNEKTALEIRSNDPIQNNQNKQVNESESQNNDKQDYKLNQFFEDHRLFAFDCIKTYIQTNVLPKKLHLQLSEYLDYNYVYPVYVWFFNCFTIDPCTFCSFFFLSFFCLCT